MREYVAAKPVPVVFDGREYQLLYTWAKVKRIREALKVDLLRTSDVGLDIFTKVLFQGLVDPKDLTEEKLDDLIAVPQLPYYAERLKVALSDQTQPSEATKNASGAPSPTGSVSAKNRKGRKRRNSASGRPQLVNGESQTASSGA